MACRDFAALFDFLVNFNGKHAFDFVACFYTDTAGMTLFALFVFGTLFAMYFVGDDSFLVPIVLAVLFGSVVVVELPGNLVMTLVVALVFGGGAAGMYIFHRASPRR